MAVGEGLVVTATSGQEALLRFNIELRRRMEARELVRIERVLEEPRSADRRLS
ncbi:MAG TPA: hypothetical protein VFS62_17435 [Chloroflexota bacterium]|nr:hypothetical protein [Chloroflexota bacterium]